MYLQKSTRIAAARGQTIGTDYCGRLNHKVNSQFQRGSQGHGGLADRLAGFKSVDCSQVRLLWHVLWSLHEAIQRMTRKWGSCSTAGTITLAIDLDDESQRFQDFVIVHELLHLKVPNHGRQTGP
jgi:Protein of unknown function DUF45